MNLPTRTMSWPPSDAERADPIGILNREWLVTNGLGGYASGTVLGPTTRRYHGPLVAALAPPLGRTMLLNHLTESLELADGAAFELGLDAPPAGPPGPGAGHLVDFRLEGGLPVWRYDAGGLVLEKRLAVEHGANTTRVAYRLLDGAGPATLVIRPAVHFRGHDDHVATPHPGRYRLEADGGRVEVAADGAIPPLRLLVQGAPATFEEGPAASPELAFPIEADRGYQSVGARWSPGVLRVELPAGGSATLVASAEPWEAFEATDPAAAFRAERDRRAALLDAAGPAALADPVAAELVLAVDQFLFAPVGRAAGTRSVVAGYHWFTDWGRDTMIGLEGLTLCTGRHAEAAAILRTFARSIRDGLIPNLIPEGAEVGLYHTADATPWFFHALNRYVRAAGDRGILGELVPQLLDVVDHHLRGTRFGIGVDPADGLLRQGAEGYQLTWMDAKVDGWVVTPRRGKAVEINALWYNALKLLEGWAADLGRAGAAARLAEHAARARESFHRRFWDDRLGHLLDVVDGQSGDDPACRPNQLFAITLDHPVLDPTRWPSVLETCRARLLTPAGLRSLAPGEPDYKPTYRGDLRTRDAAYHQGTVWSWLIGPMVDAHLKVHPDDRAGARALLDGLVAHLGEAGLGTVSEVFDAEAPHHPRGCVAQAWGVAELLRCRLRTA